MGSKHRPPRWWLDYEQECADHRAKTQTPQLTVARVVRRRGLRWLLARLGLADGHVAKE